MKRRSFLKGSAAAGLATTAVAAPAIAQSMPELKWRLATSWPKSLDTISGTIERFAKAVGEMTDQRFQIRVFAPGEIVPALQVLDAVQAGTIEMGGSAGSVFFGKNPAFGFDTGLPFGMNSRQHASWLLYGGGTELIRPLYKEFNTIQFPMGATGAQMGGWYRKEINSPEDLKGLKFRIGGFPGRIFLKVGGVPQGIPGGDVYPALERGAIDGAEWVGPYDDEKLGFNKVAKYYYYPAWWEPGSILSLFVNLPQWEALPKMYKQVVQSAANEAILLNLALYDNVNPPALRRLVASGTILKPFPRSVMETCYAAAMELYDELAAESPHFKRIYEPWKAYRAEQHLWFRVAENTSDSFMYSVSAKQQ